MPEDKGYTQVPATLPDGKEVTIFVDGGKPKSEQAFQDAIESYYKGDKPKGFTIVPSDSVQGKIREAYEMANVPIQKAAEKVSEAPSSVGLLERATGKSLGPMGNFLASRVNPGTAMPMALYDAVKGLIPGLAENVSTPTKAAATGGMLASMAATGGMSGILPLLARVGATGLSAGAGSYFGGQAIEPPGQNVGIGNKKLDISGIKTAGNVAKDVALGAAAAAVGESAMGAFRFITGSTMTKRASAQVAEDTMTALKKEFPDLARTGANGLKAMASTEKGVKQLSQIGVKGLRASSDDLAAKLMSDLNQSSPRTMGKVTERHLSEVTKNFLDYTDDLYNKIGTNKAATIADTQAAFKELNDGIKRVLTKEFTKGQGQLNPVTLVRIDKAVKEFTERQSKLLEGAEVIQVLKDSVVKGKFNTVKFQEIMSERLYSGGELMENVGKAAGRGKVGGIDTAPSEFGIRTPLGKFGFDVPQKVADKFAKTYAGTVRGVPSVAPADIATIREFLKED